MAKELIGVLDGKGKRIGIVVSRFNDLITKRLLEGAYDCLMRHGVKESDITTAWVPGSFEIPPVAKRLAANGKLDAVICLGTIIRGETPHFDYIAGQSSKGIGQIALESKIPIIYGVLTCDSVDQAVDRAGTKSGNRGWQAALTALEMANLYLNL
ncbi:MAG: 6,7-dimethyl-8-ribityllumazine synthase [Candidatus Omnitrophica bacterium]|nr:6,7-dimethyl-8-ribityllumazine synthase [Candidatus Omnitrophota bacterium]